MFQVKVVELVNACLHWVFNLLKNIDNIEKQNLNYNTWTISHLYHPLFHINNFDFHEKIKAQQLVICIGINHQKNHLTNHLAHHHKYVSNSSKGLNDYAKSSLIDFMP